VVRRLSMAGLLALIVAYLLYLRSDAHRNGNRLFYQDGRPNRLGKVVGRAYAFALGFGLGPSWAVTLETRGHRTGRTSAVPLVVADHGGRSYVVSMLGERSPWVHNVRAAGGRAIVRHGRRREVVLVEVPPAERAPLLKVYLGRAIGARPHIPVNPDAPIEAFEAIAGQYPMFRIEGLV
jgi:deazaflavin-dependent oxidoreductase (nitroreductase family)